MANIRKLTVSAQFKISSARHLPQGFTQVPTIRLNGNWLKHAGFDPGDKIKVKVSQNTLVITRL